MNRLASLIKFKEGVTKEEAIEALRKIRDVLDVPAESYDRDTRKWGPTKAKHMVEEYNPEQGSPVFYIP